MLLKTVRYTKDLLLYLRITQLLNPFNRFFDFLSNFNALISWIIKNKNLPVYNDFYTPSRNHSKRYEAFKKLVTSRDLDQKKIIYLEYGVASGNSIKWWIEKNINPSSAFYGFDTFEGLPENWSMFFNKGDMKFQFPDISDTRVALIKGLFQDTMLPFIEQHNSALKNTYLVIHLDADLFTATLFVLTQLYPYLKKGDIIMFDEFNVATHEFKAFKIFTDSFYIKLNPLYAVNNYYQVGFEVE